VDQIQIPATVVSVDRRHLSQEMSSLPLQEAEAETDRLVRIVMQVVAVVALLSRMLLVETVEMVEIAITTAVQVVQELEMAETVQLQITAHSQIQVSRQVVAVAVEEKMVEHLPPVQTAV
jgi:hypothetical protein